MKISSKGRYGIRTLVDLAIHSHDRPVTLSEIAKRQNMSSNYLEQHFSTLKKHNLVKSMKGPNGGYQLFKGSENITLKEILNALEGSLSVIEAHPKKNEDDISIDAVMNDFIWEKLDLTIHSFIESITLLDIVTEYQNKSNQNNFMFYI